MDEASIVFIAVGVVVVIVVGRLLTLTGRRYVGGVDGAGANVGTVAPLLATMFHLVTLGATVLIAVLPVGGDVTGFLIRLGTLLLIVGVIYGGFVAALARRREVAITEAAVNEPPTSQGQEDNPSAPSHRPSYLPRSGLPRGSRGDGT